MAESTNPSRGPGRKAAARERIAAKRAAEAAQRAADQRRRRTVVGGSIAAVVVVIAVVVAIVIQTSGTGTGLTDDQLVAYAEQAGATGADVGADIRNLVFGEWAKGATDQASQDGVTGTPTVFVDGTKLTDLTADGLTAAVQAAQRG